MFYSQTDWKTLRWHLSLGHNPMVIKLVYYIGLFFNWYDRQAASLNIVHKTECSLYVAGAACDMRVTWIHIHIINIKWDYFSQVVVQVSQLQPIYYWS